MQIKQEQRQESDATVKKVEEDRGLSTQVNIEKWENLKWEDLIIPSYFDVGKLWYRYNVLQIQG